MMVISMSEKEVVLKLYHNVEMGVVGIEAIEDKIDSIKFYHLIIKEKEEYQRIADKMSSLCEKYDLLHKEISPMASVCSSFMVFIKLMRNYDVSKIAKMMIEGTNKGIIELETLQNHYQGEDQNLKDIISEMITMEQKNIEELKAYL